MRRFSAAPLSASCDCSMPIPIADLNSRRLNENEKHLPVRFEFFQRYSFMVIIGHRFTENSLGDHLANSFIFHHHSSPATLESDKSAKVKRNKRAIIRLQRLSSDCRARKARSKLRRGALWLWRLSARLHRCTLADSIRFAIAQLLLNSCSLLFLSPFAWFACLHFRPGGSSSRLARAPMFSRMV